LYTTDRIYDDRLLLAVAQTDQGNAATSLLGWRWPEVFVGALKSTPHFASRPSHVPPRLFTSRASAGAEARN